VADSLVVVPPVNQDPANQGWFGTDPWHATVEQVDNGSADTILGSCIQPAEAGIQQTEHMFVDNLDHSLQDVECSLHILNPNISAIDGYERACNVCMNVQ